MEQRRRDRSDRGGRETKSREGRTRSVFGDVIEYLERRLVERRMRVVCWRKGDVEFGEELDEGKRSSRKGKDIFRLGEFERGNVSSIGLGRKKK
jgi:hypothetical protein